MSREDIKKRAHSTLVTLLGEDYGTDESDSDDIPDSATSKTPVSVINPANESAPNPAPKAPAFAELSAPIATAAKKKSSKRARFAGVEMLATIIYFEPGQPIDPQATLDEEEEEVDNSIALPVQSDISSEPDEDLTEFLREVRGVVDTPEVETMWTLSAFDRLKKREQLPVEPGVQPTKGSFTFAKAVTVTTTKRPLEAAPKSSAGIWAELAKPEVSSQAITTHFCACVVVYFVNLGERVESSQR